MSISTPTRTAKKRITGNEIKIAIAKFVLEADDGYYTWRDAQNAGYVGCNCSFRDIDSDIDTALKAAALLDDASPAYREYLLAKIDEAMHTNANDAHIAWKAVA